MDGVTETDYPTAADARRLTAAFLALSPGERQLLLCALAGNHPPKLAELRMPVLRGLAKADRLEKDAADA